MSCILAAEDTVGGKESPVSAAEAEVEAEAEIEVEMKSGLEVPNAADPEEKQQTEGCNLCNDPACRRKKGEPKTTCIHYGKKK